MCDMGIGPRGVEINTPAPTAGVYSFHGDVIIGDGGSYVEIKLKWYKKILKGLSKLIKK